MYELRWCLMHGCTQWTSARHSQWTFRNPNTSALTRTPSFLYLQEIYLRVYCYQRSPSRQERSLDPYDPLALCRQDLQFFYESVLSYRPSSTSSRCWNICSHNSGLTLSFQHPSTLSYGCMRHSLSSDWFFTQLHSVIYLPNTYHWTSSCGGRGDAIVVDEFIKSHQLRISRPGSSLKLRPSGIMQMRLKNDPKIVSRVHALYSLSARQSLGIQIR